MEIVYILSSDLSRREKRPYGGGCVELLLVDDALYLLQGQISCDGDDGKFIFFILKRSIGHEIFPFFFVIVGNESYATSNDELIVSYNRFNNIV